MSARFTKHEDAWAIRTDADHEIGEVVTVTRRDNSESDVVLTGLLAPRVYSFTNVEVETERSAPSAPRSSLPPITAEGAEALRLFQTGKSLAIQAGAGTGKTTALQRFADDAHGRGLRGQYIAFNNAIVGDVGGKFPGSVTANTMHSLAMRAVGRPFMARKDASTRMKGWNIARVLGIRDITVETYDGKRKTLSGSFLSGIVLTACKRFCQSDDDNIGSRHVPYIPGLDGPAKADRPTSTAVNREVAVALEPVLRRAWADLIRYEGELPFTISTAMAVILKLWQLNEPRIHADYILFDEAQDMSPVMIDIIRQQTHTQVVWVGDSNQAIYTFTGAVDALERIDTENTAYLTQSFRFGPAVADIANEVLSMLRTPMRLVGTDDIPSVVDIVAEPDAVLTRTNATAVRMIMTAIANDQKPFLVGGGAEITRFCRAANDLMGGRRTEHPELACFESWDEVRTYVEEDEQGADLRLMVKLIDEFGVNAILDAVNGCTTEADADLIVSTAHKSKGRQWKAVLLGGDFPEREKMNAEELRLLYVAVTRAQLALDITGVPFFGAPDTEGGML